MREVSREYVCLGCGEEHTIHTAERVGGPDGIKLKTEMSEDELEKFRREVRSGGFYNGFPDHHNDYFMAGGA